MRSTPRRSPKLKATNAVKASNNAVKVSNNAVKASNSAVKASNSAVKASNSVVRASNSVVRAHPTLCAAKVVKAVKATALTVNPSANRSAMATTASREIPANRKTPNKVAGKVDKADANPKAA